MENVGPATYRARKNKSAIGFSTSGLKARAHITIVKGTRGLSVISRAALTKDTINEKAVDMRPTAAKARNDTKSK